MPTNDDEKGLDRDRVVEDPNGGIWIDGKHYDLSSDEAAQVREMVANKSFSGWMTGDELRARLKARGVKRTADGGFDFSGLKPSRLNNANKPADDGRHHTMASGTADQVDEMKANGSFSGWRTAGEVEASLKAQGIKKLPNGRYDFSGVKWRRLDGTTIGENKNRATSTSPRKVVAPVEPGLWGRVVAAIDDHWRLMTGRLPQRRPKK